MVHRASKSSKTLTYALAGILIALILICGIKIVSFPMAKEQPETKNDTKEIVEQPKEEPQKEISEFIDLQAVLDGWAKRLGNNVGVYIYDLDNEKEAAVYNEDKIFSTASVYKLFFVYEAYLRINQGIDDPNEYFADGKTRIECLDLIIRESYNPCADPLRSSMMSEINDIISEKFQIENTSNGALNASPRAVAEMLKIYYKHEDLSEELWTKIADSMLNQPVTTYNWRQGLPAGFNTAKVYNKVGWSFNTEENRWNIYNDAAIVEFEELDRHYIIVVLTKNTSNRKLVELGQILEQEILKNN